MLQLTVICCTCSQPSPHVQWFIMRIMLQTWLSNNLFNLIFFKTLKEFLQEFWCPRNRNNKFISWNFYSQFFIESICVYDANFLRHFKRKEFSDERHTSLFWRIFEIKFRYALKSPKKSIDIEPLSMRQWKLPFTLFPAFTLIDVKNRLSSTSSIWSTLA